jgi:hypothetical protein
LTFFDTFGHFFAITAIDLSKKLGAAAKLDQPSWALLPKYVDTSHDEGVLASRQDAALVLVPPTACKDASMAHTKLRIYRGPAEQVATRPVKTAAPTVTVNLNEVLPLLADAVASRRTWLSDFAEDQITIPSDLHEVLLAYQYYRHPAA